MSAKAFTFTKRRVIRIVAKEKYCQPESFDDRILQAMIDNFDKLGWEFVSLEDVDE